jgi:hypothetical protein
MMARRDAFSAPDDPVGVSSDPEEVVSELVDDEISPEPPDQVEPELDE